MSQSNKYSNKFLDSLYRRRESKARITLLSSFVFVGFSIYVTFAFPKGFFIPLCCLCLVAARILYIVSTAAHRDALAVRSGALGEQTVLEILRSLPAEWQVEYNVRLEKRGDVDVFLTSPSKHYFALEVKAHKAEIDFNGQYLIAKSRHLEKDFLKQATDAAIGIKSIRSLPYVEAILVFTRAKLCMSRRDLNGVKVLAAAELLPYLQQRERLYQHPRFSPTVSNTMRIAEEVQTYPSYKSQVKQQQSWANNVKFQNSVAVITDLALRQNRARAEHGLYDVVTARAEIQLILLLLSIYDISLEKGSPYRLMSYECFRCNAPIVVFDWGEPKIYRTERPPEPRPVSLQWRSSKGQDCYWANTCQVCNVLQGDSHVFAKPPQGQWYSHDQLITAREQISAIRTQKDFAHPSASAAFW